MFTSGILEKDRIWKFLITLIKNGSHQTFNSVGVNISGSKTKTEDFTNKNWNKLWKKIQDVEFYGTCHGTCHNNL